MRPKRRRSRPKGSKRPAARAPSPEAEEPKSERGAPVEPPPAPEPVPQPPAEDPRVGELQDQVSELMHKLEDMAEPETGNVDERFQGMEDRMKSLLQLSEILSVRYNPFLEEEEQSLYDDHSVEEFLPESMRGQGLTKGSKPAGAEVVPVEPDPEVPLGPANVAHADEVNESEDVLGLPEEEFVEEAMEELDEIPEPAAESPAPAPAVPAPHENPAKRAVMDAAEPAAPAPAKPAAKPAPTEAPPAAPQVQPAPPVQAAPAPQAPPVQHAPFKPAPPRSAYFALCWFERLASAGDPAEIHLFLDHYERLGWIPADDRGWLRELAHGIAPRRQDLAWDDLQLTGPDLARLHRDHLRILERLFHTGLVDDNPDAWERQADGLLGGA